MTGALVTKPIYVLNGPNLNRLGRREPHLYGATTLAQIEAMCREAAGDTPLHFRQSNREYELIDWIHEAIDEGSAIVINPAAFSFTSMAILDALKMFPGPIIELHITNIHRREPIYHRSYVSLAATAVIAGLGAEGYPIAVQAAKAMVDRSTP
ncbi:type II 3-dehydroquinate dehydratase [Chelatococcus asaccharovorans]|uniref:type II 3-dehydroquinate dehydratase n=1 Tax=Chelatococcus asaccharovorans TaxID=28210 RepID=UPI00224C769B|nr:type II 3-dehydroquinate dehydratase [Chelatococcus asaccharovorans]CAH1661112.1 3-dehydroquinate dehydratase 2 [Chelatococcus asaccharovorans]CAH1683573.1 3-dehydroquinate dehydratase 2 [Chelatococcus asaccharovorans]